MKKPMKPDMKRTMPMSGGLERMPRVIGKPSVPAKPPISTMPISKPAAPMRRAKGGMAKGKKK